LQQQLIHVHYGQDESLAQMARDLGLSRQTLSKHHQRALARLQQTLTQRGYGEESVPDQWEVGLL